MASSTVTNFPIHADNLALIENFHNDFPINPKRQDEDDFLKYPSLYAPVDRMTYTRHVLYSVLGHSASGSPLPKGGAPASENKFIASNDAVLEAFNKEGPCEIIGTKQNGARQALPTDTSLAYGIPPFPSLELAPKDLATMWRWGADASHLKFPACVSDTVAQMFDFRMEDEQTQMLIHPTEVIYRLRQLFRKPVKSDDPTVQAAILTEIKQIHTCAVAMTLAFEDDDDNGKDARHGRFRTTMRENRVNVTSVTKDAIKAIAPESKVKRDSEAPDGKGIEADLWFFSELLEDWGLMACLLLNAARAELDPDFRPDLCWY